MALVRALRSNWGDIVDAASLGAASLSPSLEASGASETSSASKSRRRARHEVAVTSVSLEAAGLLLGMVITGDRWRRRVIRRIRAMEAETGVALLVSRRGRGGAVVRVEGLRKVTPLVFRLLDEVGELRQRVDEIERVIGRELATPKTVARRSQ